MGRCEDAQWGSALEISESAGVCAVPSVEGILISRLSGRIDWLVGGGRLIEIWFVSRSVGLQHA
jgi:hypothetical protein